MGITLKRFLRRFTWDTYLTASQAVELGLADEVLEPYAAATDAQRGSSFVTSIARKVG
ncbi:MAG TPA: hypothetical protein VJT74_11695 [Pyrinomonadaceae bacterium]|nr:hypothetical protein [Pyrinomonadaceae bacterium]